MATAPTESPDADQEDALATRAAWLYYAGGMTQSEVAAALMVAPAKAHRLVARASRLGSVRVFVEGPIAGCMQQERHLIREFGLRFCRVVPTLAPEALPLRALGIAMAGVLLNELEAGRHRVIGVGHGRTLAAAIDHLPRLSRPDLRFVSLLGGVPRQTSATPFDVILRLAEKAGAEAYLLPVPFFANSAADRAVLLGQRGVAQAMAMAREATLYLVGIGDVAGEQSFLPQTGIVSAAEAAALQARGAVGEVLGRYLDATGREIDTDLHERVIALPLDAMAGREVLGVAGGASKVAALRAVLARQVLSGLITDELTARQLLEPTGPRQQTKGSYSCTRKRKTSRAPSSPAGSVGVT
ncbi:MAG: sugar-binding transcriptional regulator [Acidibrevibacterium sp.]|jgi:DNA-binding transcriptional regulator LsrR (DeoR family)|uniref:sugar-binding transcriptional regulator n=1 Tax=Acidibrevibacterium fodinaquatile TaxID=1969806 RepID=UPI000E0D596D|nr:sugar-binding transcriptional regulator [Acidibrevibacterium fodinaquatile]MCA7120395.1 sugar-binding transcriptional regulator [Acidibrevibacterium fodinaquatile]